MTVIHDRALSLPVKEPLVPLGSASPAHGAAASPYVHVAREILAQQNTVGPTRMRFLKRIALRASRLFTHRLVAASETLATSIEQLESAHAAELASLRTELAALRQDMTIKVEQGVLPHIVSIELQVNEALDAHAAELTNLSSSITADLEGLRTAEQAHRAASADQTDTLAQRLAALEKTTGHDRSELHRVRASLGQLARHASKGDEAPREEVSVMSAFEQQVYVDFERRFRGTRDEVMARQRDALRFVRHLAGSPAPVADLGCGRGEWLELLSELGIDAYGVDLNDEMIAEVKARGLDGRIGDALDHLENVAPSSLQAVTGFHIAEHLSMTDLGRLVDAALVALRPGGMLLLETPNPTNLAVGAAAFYLDPTHLRPLHPQFMTFLLESRGFTDVETHFVHPVKDHATSGDGSGQDELEAATRWALFGPQDFVVVARRHEVYV